jgi:hypothetical protein
MEDGREEKKRGEGGRRGEEEGRERAREGRYRQPANAPNGAAKVKIFFS